MTRTRPLPAAALVLAAVVGVGLLGGGDAVLAVLLVTAGVAVLLAAVAAVTLVPLLVVLHRADARGRSPVAWGAVQAAALVLAAAVVLVLGVDVGPVVVAFLLAWGPAVAVGTTREVPALLRAGRHELPRPATRGAPPAGAA